MIQPTYAQPIPQAYQQQPGAGGANAVAINIYNPQAYGNSAGQQPLTNSMYQLPQQSLYNPQQAMTYPDLNGYAIPYQAQMMQYPQDAINSVAQYQLPEPPVPGVMPQSVMNPQVADAQDTNVSSDAPVDVVPVDEQQVETVDTDALINDLKSADSQVKEAAISKIAEYAQNENPAVAQQVMVGPIFQGLVDEINTDTTNLEGPTEEQLKIAEKLNNGEQLTPEEDALSEQLSPRDAANMNRIFSLYTLAMLQRLQRDYQQEYVQNQEANGEQPDNLFTLEDLAGIGDVVNVIANDSRNEVKIAAIQALKHVVNPEDKAQVEAIVNESKILESEDPSVKAAAEELMSVFSQENAEQQNAEEQKAA